MRLTKPIAREAREVALLRLRSFLRNVDSDQFRSGDEFADAVVDEIQSAYEGSFTSARAAQIVRTTTKNIYTFYRLRDRTPFGGEKPPVKIEFGGPDIRALDFFDRLDGFYFSSFVDNRRPELKAFFRREYLEKGAALFGRETGEALDDFRKAAGGKLDRLNDHAVRTIITSSVQRTRNYAHILSLRQARFKYARVSAILDARTTEICRHLDGKLLKVSVAAKAIDRFVEMEPGEYALKLYQDKDGRAFATDPVGYVKSRVSEDGVIADSLVAEGRGFPPYHPNCRTIVEGVFD